MERDWANLDSVDPDATRAAVLPGPEGQHVVIASRASVRAAHDEDSLAGALLETRDALHGPVTREGREREGRGLGKLDVLRLLGQEALFDERVLGEHALPALHR